MYVLKYIGGIILIVCGALTGLYLSHRVKRRLVLFEEYESFLLGCGSMICHCGAEVRVIGEYCCEYPSLAAAGAAFYSAPPRGNDPCLAWKAAVRKMTAEYALSQKEEGLLSDFGEGFGSSDCDAETARLSLIRDRTALHLKELRKETSEKTRIYRVVGTFAGALAAAVVI